MTSPTGDDSSPLPFDPSQPPQPPQPQNDGSRLRGSNDSPLSYPDPTIPSPAPYAAGPPVRYSGAAPTPYGGTAPLPKRRNVFGVWLGLPIITLGIYSLVWWYKVNRESRFNPRTQVSPLVSLIAVTFGAFLIIPPFVSVYRTGQRIADAQRAAGLSSTCAPVIGLVLTLFFSLYTLYYQAEMNKIVEAYPGATTGQQVPLRGA